MARRIEAAAGASASGRVAQTWRGLSSGDDVGGAAQEAVATLEVEMDPNAFTKFVHATTKADIVAKVKRGQPPGGFVGVDLNITPDMVAHSFRIVALARTHPGLKTSSAKGADAVVTQAAIKAAMESQKAIESFSGAKTEMTSLSVRKDEEGKRRLAGDMLRGTGDPDRK